MAREPIIPCKLLDSTRQSIVTYAEELKAAAVDIGNHGMADQEFWESGIFRSAIERLRGIQAASTTEKTQFVASILNYLLRGGDIRSWRFAGADERHDYEIVLNDGRICVIEAKGCLDGNNTNIFERPPNADEFLIWSLCQNPGSDPAKNAWSGIHTRLSAEVIHQQQKVDGVIIWDMVCGTRGRPCPKLDIDNRRGSEVGDRTVPPPCIYLFPRTVPDPRNNPAPPCHTLSEVGFLSVLYSAFAGSEDDVVEVGIQARMAGSNVERRTIYHRGGVLVSESRWTKLKRAG